MLVLPGGCCRKFFKTDFGLYFAFIIEKANAFAAYITMKGLVCRGNKNRAIYAKNCKNSYLQAVTAVDINQQVYSCFFATITIVEGYVVRRLFST